MDLLKITSLMTFVILFNSSSYGASKLSQDDDPPILFQRPHLCPRQQPAIVNYNSSTTQLKVDFKTSQGGRVEIYRNGVKVVNTSAPAGTNLSYVLRNYGKGEFTIIVSQGNTVVYSKQVTVK